MARTSLIIIGTLHLNRSEYPAYGDWLEGAIENTAPDLICAELSPEQLAGTQPCNSKPEQRDIVIPSAKRLNLPIVPIQPSTAHGLAWEQRYTAARENLRQTAKSAAILDFLDHLYQTEADIWRTMMHQPEGIRELQSNVYDTFPAARDAAVEKFLPQIGVLMTEWNQRFLEVIEDTIDQNTGKRILIIAGLWHKFWLWNRLGKRDDIDIYNVRTFLQLEKD